MGPAAPVSAAATGALEHEPPCRACPCGGVEAGVLDLGNRQAWPKGCGNVCAGPWG